MRARTKPLDLAGVLAAFALLLLGACVELRDWRKLDRPWDQARLASERIVRVQRSDGPREVLSSPRIESARPDVLVGERQGRAGGTISVPLDRVASIEVRRIDVARTVAVVLVIALVVAGAVWIEFAPSAGVGL
jgi:hypothetical protein